MSRAVATRAELEAEMNAARAALIEIEDHTALCDHAGSQAIKDARKRMDAALDDWALVPQPREAT